MQGNQGGRPRGRPLQTWKEDLHDTDLLPSVPVHLRGECPLHGTRIVVSQLLNYSCATMRDTGASAREVMDAKNSLELSPKWKEQENLEHTEARDLICNKQRWSRFLRRWETAETVELPTHRHKKKKVNVKDVVSKLWDAVAQTVLVARAETTTEAERQLFCETAGNARRYWRALNTEGRSGMAGTRRWRSTAWTHVFLCRLPNTLQQHGSLAPFWQYGFENRHKRERCGLQMLKLWLRTFVSLPFF